MNLRRCPMPAPHPSARPPTPSNWTGSPQPTPPSNHPCSPCRKVEASWRAKPTPTASRSSSTSSTSPKPPPQSKPVGEQSATPTRKSKQLDEPEAPEPQSKPVGDRSPTSTASRSSLTSPKPPSRSRSRLATEAPRQPASRSSLTSPKPPSRSRSKLASKAKPTTPLRVEPVGRAEGEALLPDEQALPTTRTECGWRKRLRVELSPPAMRGATGFEDREDHRAPFASVLTE
jgi:hypothetical protein